MPKKSIPYIGEFVQSYDYPAPVRMARLLVGSGTDNDVRLTSTGVYPILDVPANTVVFSVQTRVMTAFNASVTLDIGDTATSNGYLGSAAIAPQTAVTTGVLRTSIGGAGAFAGGKNYLTASSINVTVGGAAVTAGQMEIFITFALAGDD